MYFENFSCGIIKTSCDLTMDLVEMSMQSSTALSTSPSMPEAAALAFEQLDLLGPLMASFKSLDESETEEVDTEDPQNVSDLILIGRGSKETSTPEKKQRGRKRKLSSSVETEKANNSEFQRSEYYEGEVVFARIRGHVTWPARV